MMSQPMPEPFTDETFKTAMANFASGVTVVTTVDRSGRPFGLTATAFCSVSKSPPLCLVSVATSSDAYPALKESLRFAANVLSREQTDVSAQFATHGIDKFAGVEWSAGAATGCALLPAALVSLECVAETVVAAGDHEIFVGRIVAIVAGSGRDPLVYFRARYCDVVPR